MTHPTQATIVVSTSITINTSYIISPSMESKNNKYEVYIISSSPSISLDGFEVEWIWRKVEKWWHRSPLSIQQQINRFRASFANLNRSIVPVSSQNQVPNPTSYHLLIHPYLFYSKPDRSETRKTIVSISSLHLAANKATQTKFCQSAQANCLPNPRQQNQIQLPLEFWIEGKRMRVLVDDDTTERRQI